MFEQNISSFIPEEKASIQFTQEKAQTPERHGLSATINEYTANKTPDTKLQKEMVDRAVSVARTGANEVDSRIANSFSTEIPLDAAESYSNQLAAEQQEALAGQPEKISRMQEFVTQMSAQAEALIVDISELAQNNPKLSTPEEKQTFIDAYTKEVRKMVVDATRAISHQDERASAITLGDHGWMHLTQDSRDTRIIAEGKLGRKLTPTEGFMVMVAAAYHDIGYAVPEVSDQQRESNGAYGTYDKGHPINSYVYLVKNKKRFQQILGNEAADALFQIVANHENPDRAKRAGAFKDIAEAFALADASAAFGIDKLPPVMSQIPESLAYMNAVSMAQPEAFRVIYDQLPDPKGDLNTELQIFNTTVVNQLKQSAVTAIDTNITNEEQADALKNSLDHFGPKSKKFLLGRMSAESSEITVDDQQRIVFTINGGFARKLDGEGTVTGATEASAKLTVKLFLEQAAVNLPPTAESLLVATIANGDTPNNIAPEDQQALQEAGININVVNADNPEDAYVLLSTSTIAVKSNTKKQVSAENQPFYDNIQRNLGNANIAVEQYLRQRKAAKSN